MIETLRLPALRIRQGEHDIVAFGVDGKRLIEFAAVSRVRRKPGEALQGYQRPEALAHVRGIRRYLESTEALLPNAIVVAFDHRVVFRPTGQPDSTAEYSTPGELLIPADPHLPEHERPGWIVDGQQRAAAIRDADVAQFPVAVVAFFATDEAEQRSQFILINSTKVVPRGLIHELLPDTTGQLPVGYARRQLPASVMTRLNTTEGPFRGLITSPTAPSGYITDTAVLNMIGRSLTDGCLYQYRDPDTGGGDLNAIVAHMNVFWSAVAATWPQAWELPPRLSRLTHGAGIQALGYVMDSLTENVPAGELDQDAIAVQLRMLDGNVAWCRGEVWRLPRGEQRPWNGIQNTSSDIALLTDHLLRAITPRTVRATTT
jgi:DGQHR domain-containing protein